jgi:hypothetical protein
MMFGDIEEAVRLYLDGSVPAFGSVPPNRPDEFITVERIGGPGNVILDRPMLDIHCWAEKDTRADQIARFARAEVFGLAGQTISGITVSRVEEVSGQRRLPDPKSKQPRYVFAVELYVRPLRGE